MNAVQLREKLNQAKTSKGSQKTGGTYPLVHLGMGITARIMDVTPQLAKEWLEKNPQVQRRQNRAEVEMIARLILAGKWVVNGQAVIFNHKGHLADGQHRLAGIVNANQTSTCLVVWGVQASAFNTMDSGRARTKADALTAAGFQYATRLGAAANLLVAHQNGEMANDWYRARISPQEITELIKEHPELVESLDRINRLEKALRPGAAGTLCYYLMKKKNKKECEEFFNRLESGENLERGHPILQLRDKLMQRPPKVRYSSREITIWFCKTWNLWRSGQTQKQLMATQNEKVPELV